MNYVYVHIYTHVHMYTNISFRTTAYKLPTSKEDKGICLRLTLHLCAEVILEISKEITPSNSLKPLRITNLEYFQFTKTKKTDYREVSWIMWVYNQVPEITDPKIKSEGVIWYLGESYPESREKWETNRGEEGRLCFFSKGSDKIQISWRCGSSPTGSHITTLV